MATTQMSNGNMTQTISNMKLTMNTIKGTGDFANSFWRFTKTFRLFFMSFTYPLDKSSLYLA